MPDTSGTDEGATLFGNIGLLDWLDPDTGEEPPSMIEKADQGLHENVLPKQEREWQRDAVQRAGNY